jgi:hypothetical protein
MILMTMIARVADGLPLAASIQEDEQVRFFNLKFKFFAFCFLLIVIYYLVNDFVHDVLKAMLMTFFLQLKILK